MRTCEGGCAGLRALRSRAIQTLCGNWVPMSWKRSAVSRHTTAFGMAAATIAIFRVPWVDLGEPIEAVSEVLDESPSDQTLKPAVGNPERCEVSRPEKSFLQLNVTKKCVPHK